MSLGQARTNRFQIGTAELRVGPLTAAAKLTQAHSVGLIDQAGVNYGREVAQLMGGFPKKLVDETPISETTTITGTLREYSRRNLGILLGQGLLTSLPDVKYSATGIMTGGTGATPVVPLASTADFASNTGFAMIYIVGQPELVAWAAVGTVVLNTSVALGPMDLDLFTAMNTAVSNGATLRIVKAQVLDIGNTTQTQYYAVSLVQKNLKTGRPMIYDFWKASVQGGLDYGTNADDYASSELTLNVLEPSAADYAVGGDLYHLAAIIPTCPMWRIIDSADNAV